MKSPLLFIKRVLYNIGIDIRFVRKQEERSAIEMNEVDTVNKAWSDQKTSNKFLSKPVLAMYQEMLSILDELDIELSGKSVIDVGCGNGMLLKHLSEKYNISSQTGMEYAEAALELAGKLHPPASYLVHDINLPHQIQYDAVFCTEVLEHILFPVQVFNNLLEMVSTGGTLFITVPNGRTDTYSGHINFWSPESWDVFIQENSGGLRHATGTIGMSLNYAILYK
ncbi:MAG: class I SAM-dependent methyltransferase [Bacteroidota bacterium]|nr:class I SAM-dependent methyltransferase [Bacteroidota bacterium]